MHMRPLILACTLAVLCPVKLAFPQTTAPATPEQILRSARDSEKDGIVKQLAQCPAIPPAQLSSVLQLGLRKGHLTLTTRLPATRGQSRVEIIDLPGICSLNLRQVGNEPAGKGAYEPDLFLLERYRFDELDSTVSALTVEALPTSVQLSWSSETLTGITQVMLIDQVSPTGPADDRAPANVIFKVSTHNNSGEGAEDAVELKSSDFVTLRREHPAEVQRYLGPIIRELHSDDEILPSDTVLAWQIFSGDAVVTDELERKTRAGVKQLDADDFAERDAATAALKKMGPVVAVALQRIDRATLSPQQSNIVDGLVKSFHPVTDETARKLGGDPAFLLSCLADDDPFVSQAALTRLRKVTGRAVPFDLTATRSVRRDAIEILRRRLDQISERVRPDTQK